jgi:chromosome segregation ATPase
MSNPINGGVGQWDKTSDLEWRLKQMQQDMKFMWNRLTDLEVARGEKVEPYDKRDAGEPANRHYIECLKQNAKLIEENDVLKYQYEAMHKETVACKAQLEQLQKALADKQKVLEYVMDQRDRYLKQIYALHGEIEKNDAKEQIEQLREALRRISLGSQNSGTTKEDLGAVARQSLKEGK